ncbi:MAG: metallophosphoesterase family protein [Candidatus Promineifilaceae bacterium]|nr:metallophosphoesterase family protein [Candidatus Promineifilaceae bacterium]
MLLLPEASSIGVIADTHGLMRPAALAALEGSDLIIHAGDVGKREILDSLAWIAPVVVVRGNVDRARWAEALPERAVVVASGRQILVLHDRQALKDKPERGDYDAVVAGHSHRPHVERENGVLFFNPGSAGPRRFTLPVCVGRLRVTPDQLEAEVIELPG